MDNRFREIHDMSRGRSFEHPVKGGWSFCWWDSGSNAPTTDGHRVDFPSGTLFCIHFQQGKVIPREWIAHGIYDYDEARRFVAFEILMVKGVKEAQKFWRKTT